MSFSHQEEYKSQAIWKEGVYTELWDIFPLGTEIPGDDALVSQLHPLSP